jgi:hypothetical protein
MYLKNLFTKKGKKLKKKPELAISNRNLEKSDKLVGNS